MEFGLQEFRSILIGLDMGFDCATCMLEHLFFKSLSKIKHDIVSISFESEGEEFDLKFDSSTDQVLK